MKHIVITGDQGFIGTHLKRALEAFYNAAKTEVAITLVDKVTGDDILDKTIPQADVIFHLAAQTSVDESMKNPMADAETNIAGFLKVLLDNPQAKVVITGSVAAKDPKSPYGITKLAQEHYSQVIHRNAVVCRLPNVYGEGSNHGVVAEFLKQPEITIYGSGEQTRDFVHVEDIVVGLLRAESWAPGVYELGSGQSVSIKELAYATGKPLRFMPGKPGEIEHSVTENTTPDWKPAINVLDFIKQHHG